MSPIGCFILTHRRLVALFAEVTSVALLEEVQQQRQALVVHSLTLLPVHALYLLGVDENVINQLPTPAPLPAFSALMDYFSLEL